MSSSGLSKERLERMRNVMAGYVERGDVPGIVTLISRHGEVHVEALGTKIGGRPRPDAPRHHLPDLVDDQAGCGRGGDDPGRGMQVAAG